MSHEDYIATQRGKAVEAASRIVDGSIGLTEGVRLLVGFQKNFGGAADREFLIFAGVESETDDFPIGDERKNWDAGALKVKDAELLEYEQRVRGTVVEACRRFIEKYGN